MTLDFKTVKNIVDQNFEIYLEEKSWTCIKESRLRLLEALKDEQLAVPGINRGYGWFNRTKNEGEDDAEHQLKTLRGNLVSYGEPLSSQDSRSARKNIKFVYPFRFFEFIFLNRCLFFLKIFELSKGFSGVR